MTLSKLEELIRIPSASAEDAEAKDLVTARVLRRDGTSFQPTGFIIEQLRKLGAGPVTLRALEDLRRGWPAAGGARGGDDERKIRILIADFQGPDGADEGVTGIIKEEIDDATREYEDVEVIAPGVTITKKQGRDWAREQGKEYEASIIIWGSYSVEREQVFASVHFQVLDNSLGFLFTTEKLPSQVPLAEHTHFQMRVGKEMAYLTFLTLGVIRLRESDFAGAVDLLTSAIKRSDVPERMVDPAAAYLYRGAARVLQSLLVAEVSEHALDDLDKALSLNSESAGAYSLRCSLRSLRKEFELALKDCNRAIVLEPNEANFYSSRARLHDNAGNRQSAVADMETAVNLTRDDPDSISALNDRAQLARLKGDLDGAISGYTKLLEVDLPAFLHYFVLLGRAAAYHEKGQMDLARQDLKQSVELVDRSALSYWLLGDIAYETKDYAEAISNYRKATDFGLHDAELYVDLGDAYAAKGETAQALKSYEKAIELDPAEGHKQRGRFFRRRGETDKAIEDYNAALKLNPRISLGHLFRGSAYFAKGVYDKALSDFDEAARLEPNQALVYEFRGDLYDVRGEIKLAISDYEKAIGLGEKDAGLFIKLAAAYEKSGDVRAALTNYSRAVEVEPKNATAYQKRGDYYLSKNQLDSAIEDYKKSVALDPSNGQVYFTRGHAYESKGRPEEALADYETAVRLMPNSVAARYARGAQRDRRGDLAGAAEDYGKVIELAPRFEEAYLKRAVVLFRQGKYEGAAGDFGKVIEMNPGQARAYIGRGLVRMAMPGQHREGAISDFNKVLELSSDPELRKLATQYLTKLNAVQPAPEKK